jgi:hypothetical protein
MTSLPIGFFTPFLKHFPRRCGTPQVRFAFLHVGPLPLFHSLSEFCVLRTILAAARAAALEKCFGKPKPSLVAAAIPDVLGPVGGKEMAATG